MKELKLKQDKKPSNNKEKSFKEKVSVGERKRKRELRRRP
jgi:hypothetical protein